MLRGFHCALKADSPVGHTPTNSIHKLIPRERPALLMSCIFVAGHGMQTCAWGLPRSQVVLTGASSSSARMLSARNRGAPLLAASNANAHVGLLSLAWPHAETLPLPVPTLLSYAVLCYCRGDRTAERNKPQLLCLIGKGILNRAANVLTGSLIVLGLGCVTFCPVPVSIPVWSLQNLLCTSNRPI